MSQGFDVAVVGATGAVGREFLSLFEQRAFPIRSLRLLASKRSAGTQVNYRNGCLTVEEATPDSLRNVDFAFFSAGASTSRSLVPRALEAGAYVIDNSSAFRMDPGVPLLVPEVNPGSWTPDLRLISVPNCTAIILTTAVAPLRQLGKIERLIVSTYQSASGGGAAMMDRLKAETRVALENDGMAIVDPDSPIPPYAFNLFSHNTPIGPDGSNEEEAKVIAETRKILDQSDLKINATCVRVPVLRAHSESVTVEFNDYKPNENEIRAILESAPGVRVFDDRAGNRFPTPFDASGTDNVLVGRIRLDPSHPRAISLFIAGDQLRKGAALNAVQIAEHIIGCGQPAGAVI